MPPLGVLSANNSASTGQIASITAEQIAVLSPAQVRMLGATVDGVMMTSKINQLNSGAWSKLASDPEQVKAITAAEIPTLGNEKIVALGTNIKYLSDAALGALTLNNSAASGQIAAITAEQIAVLTPAQVRLLGATVEGVTRTSYLGQLNGGAWSKLASDPEQIKAITAAEIP